MSLWDDLPPEVRNGGALDGLQPLLENVATPTSTERTEADGTRWRIFTSAFGGTDPLSLNPSTGAFTRGAAGASNNSTPIEFPDPSVDVEVGLRLSAPGGTPDGTVRVIILTPSAIVRLPFLRGARLDAQGQLRADTANPTVKFILPELKIRVLRPAGQGISVDLLSASTSGTGTDQIYDFIRMEPQHALIGPGDVVGFAFRSAVLDLSGTAGPSGVPAEARVMPGEWQGFFLPEARLFVAPSGLEGLAVSAGVRNLWIGFGRHAGVTGIFEAEVVNRGASPTVRLRFQSTTGAWIGVPDTDPPTPIDLPADVRLFVDAGGGLAPYRYSIRVGSSPEVTTDRADVAVPATGTVSIVVGVTDGSNNTVTRTISVQRSGAATGAAAGGTAPVGVVTTSLTGTRVVMVSQTATAAVLRLEPAGGTVTWAWTGGSATGAEVTVPVGAGASVTVTATRTRAPGAVLPIDAYMLFDRPTAADGVLIASTPVTRDGTWADNPANVHAQPANSRTGWGSSPELVDPAFLTRLAAVPAGTTWTVDGFASYEGDDSAGQRDRNRALSERRRDTLVRILRRNGFDGRVSAGTAHGHDSARDGVSPDGGTAPAPGASAWWRARAVATLPSGTSETITGVVSRVPVLPTDEERDPEPTRRPVPDCFRKIGVRVELVRSTFIRAEVYGEFDVQTAAEQRLSSTSPGATIPARTNPADGICTFLVRLRIAEDRSSWDVTAEFRALEGDLDGLAKVTRSATGDPTGINILGAVAALSPLLAAVTPPNPTAGELVPMVIVGGAAVALGASGVLATQAVILRGGELVVTDGLIDPASGTGPRTTTVSVLLDVETSFTFDLGFIRVDPQKPITTRYEAVGLRSTWESRPRTNGTVEYVPLPVFDPSRGYSLDVPAGSLVAAPPLGELLRVLGVRISRDNPTYLEVEVGLGVDLGIVTVDTVRVRLRLDQAELPQITKLGASIDVPGTLHGSGYVQITSTGFEGAFDLTVTSLNLRASAQLAVATVDGVTGVLVGAEVQFPVPLPLGNSGLGLFGFLGGVGVNYRRREPTGVQVPALRWLEAQLGPPRNSVMHPTGWEHSAGSYAFAAGLLLGTAEGGFVVHLKGIVMIEVPGPRLLLVMKADVLKLPPVLKSQSSATFLAVLDIDFGRGTITLGIVAEYSIVSLLHIRVPVTAFFNTNQPQEWFVDLGNFTDPVTVQILDVFSGTGYLMVHGNGIVHPRLPIVSSGLTIAVGFHLQAVLMGSKSVGLYLEVAAGFDALVSFEPFAIGGYIYARGELRLFIIGIAASAELTVLIGRQRLGNGTEVERTYVHGEVCGEVDLFFFSIKGCVSLTLGDAPPDAPIAPPLVAGVKLVSRSPALLEGSATDRALDGVLADAVRAGDVAPLPTVPLDAVPVILFETPPSVASGNVVLNGVAAGTSGLTADPWVRRGDSWWRYEVTGVELVGALQPAAPSGKTPATWWNRGTPADPQHGPALALLSWLPTPFSRAMPYGETLTTTVTQQWGRICGPVAPPAPVLWTFDRQPIGASRIGWTLPALPWPDAPGVFRSAPVSAPLTVTERWRSGDAEADVRQGTDPARVIGDKVPCPDDKFAPVTSLQQWGVGQPQTFSRATMPDDDASLLMAAELLADGASLTDVPARYMEQAWDNTLARVALTCDGRVLRSPTDDDDEPAPSGDDEDRDFVKERWAKAGFTPSSLADSIVLRTPDGFTTFVVALLVHRKLIEVGLVARFLNTDGKAIGEQRINGSHLVSSTRPLPARWTDGAGPWANPVERAGRIAARIAAQEPSLVLVLFTADVPRDCAAIEIGWERARFEKEVRPAFYVVAMEGLVASEAARFEWDTTTTTKDREALVTAVTQDPDDHALLVPGVEYTVRVRWHAESVEQEDKPSAAAPPNWAPEQQQEFRFAADPVSEAPPSLDPWVLATAPSMGETGALCREPVRLALSTQKVVDLFRAYNEELRVVVRSASGRHPVPPGGGAPGDSVTIPLALSADLTAAISVTKAPKGLSIMTPWQEAVTDLLNAKPCTPDAGSDTHHVVVTLRYDLEPLTDYILDVLAVPVGSPQNTSGRRVHRINFTTSRFFVADDLATLVRQASIEHRLVPTPAPLVALPVRPTGDQVDVAFQQAGLGVPQVPRYPRVQVLWSTDAVPQPVAVVVESSETLWRQRPMPTEVAGPVDALDPTHKWWKAVQADWLALRVSAAPVAAGDPPRATVTRLVHGPGGTRAIALLGAGARGAEVRLDLVVTADLLAGTADQATETLRVRLTRAPWEVED